MGGKGGNTSAGPMLEYGNKALGLQKEIYDQTRKDAQPWYQAGTSAVNELSKRLGLSNNAGSMDRNLLLAQNRDKFATQQTTPSAGNNLWVDTTGKVVDFDNTRGLYTMPEGYDNVFGAARENYNKGNFDAIKNFGYTQLNPSTTSNNVDEAGLNAYVDNLIAQGSADATDPTYGSLLQGFDMSKFQEDPGYQFRLAEGTKALERKLNASGKTYSPEAAKALQSYGQGLASEEYGNAYNRYNMDQDTIFNRLAAVSGFGQTASGQLANAGANYAQGGTDLYTGMGNAITAANVARANQGSSMFNTLLGAGAQLGGNYMMASALSDRRLKENIIPMGEENGHKVYEFNYIGKKEKYIGVMSDEVDPSAVIRGSDGYDRVNYSMIGVDFREVKNAQ